MEHFLFLAHVESDGSLGPPALETLDAAVSLTTVVGGAQLTVGLIGDNAQHAANQVAGCGAQRFLAVTGTDFTQPRYATDAAAAEAIARTAQATLVLAPGTARWSRVLAGLAHRLGGRVDTHITATAVKDGVPLVTRWYYRQRMEAVLTRTQRPWCLSLDPGSHPAWSGSAGIASLEMVPVSLPPDAKRTQVTGVQSPPADAQTIRPDARLLLVAGGGWTKKQADGKVHAEEAQRFILDFLRLAQASLGGTKSLVDMSGEGQAVLTFMTHLNQVGQTGSTPRHAKGLATCCHGEEPHVVGWRFINERRAINLDPNCSWARGKTDVLYVADAFAVMEKVNALLAAT
jgi:electron transfer flavoprotein alpha subunit